MPKAASDDLFDILQELDSCPATETTGKKIQTNDEDYSEEVDETNDEGKNDDGLDVNEGDDLYGLNLWDASTLPPAFLPNSAVIAGSAPVHQQFFFLRIHLSSSHSYFYLYFSILYSLSLSPLFMSLILMLP